MIRECIRLLSEGKELTAEQISGCMADIMRGEATGGQIGAFLMALHFQKGDLSPTVIYNSASTMLGFSLPCSLKSPSKSSKFDLTEGNGVILDIVGTGGDTWDTFNASSAAAFITAAAGVTVAKHGNRSSSGRCGSADLIEALGANLMLDHVQTGEIIDKCGFGFLFAQKFHPAMKAVSTVRKEIGFRTIFNIMGPLSNPARPTHMLVGVGIPELGPVYAEIFQMQKIKKALVVHSKDGLDEITTSASTQVWLVEEGKPIQEMEISPEDFGLSNHPLESILGSSPDVNSATFRKILDGEEGPVTDFLLLNAGAALFLCGAANDFKAGADLAREVLKSGKAKQLVNEYVQLSKTYS